MCVFFNNSTPKENFMASIIERKSDSANDLYHNIELKDTIADRAVGYNVTVTNATADKAYAINSFEAHSSSIRIVHALGVVLLHNSSAEHANAGIFLMGEGCPQLGFVHGVETVVLADCPNVHEVTSETVTLKNVIVQKDVNVYKKAILENCVIKGTLNCPSINQTFTKCIIDTICVGGLPTFTKNGGIQVTKNPVLTLIDCKVKNVIISDTEVHPIIQYTESKRCVSP